MAKTQKRQSLPSWMWVGMALFVAILVYALAFMRPAPGTSTPYPAEVTVPQAAEKRNAGAFMLDVREPQEWEEVHIPDATLIPLGQLQARLDEIPRDQEVVVVCRSGNRSAEARNILRRAGFEQVTSMAGGMIDWQAQGFPIAIGQ
jgi:rhodanese-related sulfurtransferase